MNALLTNSFATVYGPVVSWRYGRSLGIDPIGPTSTIRVNLKEWVPKFVDWERPFLDVAFSQLWPNQIT
jgi:hypothetical protein